MKSMDERTHVEDLLGNEWAPTKRPIKSVDGSVPREEVVSPDIGGSCERIEASAYEHKGRGVVDFVKDDLENLICAGLSATQGCGATAATHRQDGPFPVQLG
jgi:hypothetical protein